jgi:hypothetical protein
LLLKIEETMGRYDDIIDLPYKKSKRHAHMSMHDRAAQFAPFAALTGYGEAVEETARFTEAKIELAEDRIAEINEVLTKLKKTLDKPLGKVEVELDFFVQDKLKQGGKYLLYKGTVDKLDEHEKRLRLGTGIWINIEDIFDIKLKE